MGKTIEVRISGTLTVEFVGEDAVNLIAKDTKEPLDVGTCHQGHPTPSLMELWNNSCDPLPKATKMTDKRQRKWRSRYHEMPTVDYWTRVIKRMAASPFLRGDQSPSSWRATVDFLLRPDTHVKVSEGIYDERRNKERVLVVS